MSLSLKNRTHYGKRQQWNGVTSISFHCIAFISFPWGPSHSQAPPCKAPGQGEQRGDSQAQRAQDHPGPGPWHRTWCSGWPGEGPCRPALGLYSQGRSWPNACPTGFRSSLGSCNVSVPCPGQAKTWGPLGAGLGVQKVASQPGSGPYCGHSHRDMAWTLMVLDPPLSSCEGVGLSRVRHVASLVTAATLWGSPWHWKGTGTKVGLPQHRPECVGSCLHAGKLFQVILRVHLLKLGSVKQRKGLRERRQDHSNRSEARQSCADLGKDGTVTGEPRWAV